jgi:hypothetical protein
VIILALVSLSGALSLFLLRKEAYYIFCASLVINVTMTLWHCLTKGWLAAIGSIRGGIPGLVIGWGIVVAVCIYSGKLKNRRILI